MRVIAGLARGRNLRAPKEAKTRPTSDLVKGAIFDILEAEALKRGFEVDEEGRMASGQCWPRVLDLFAGSGALGIEALSRGAEKADFVEHNAEAAKTIQANLRSTGLDDRGTVHRSQPAAALTRLRGPYDLVLMDPPYADTGAFRRAAEALEHAAILAPSAMVAFEHGPDLTPPEELAGLPLLRRKRHGKTGVAVYGGVPTGALGNES